MDDPKHEEHPRASLRGKGREILFGQRSADDAQEEQVAVPEEVTSPEPTGPVDAASLPLSPDETETLLEFAEDSPVYAVDPTFSVEADLPEADLTRAAVHMAPEDLPVTPQLDWLPDLSESPEIEPAEPDQGAYVPPAGQPVRSIVSPLDTEESLPLGERSDGAIGAEIVLPYQPSPEVEQLNPVGPELWIDEAREPDFVTDLMGAGDSPETASAFAVGELAVSEEAGFPRRDHEGGLGAVEQPLPASSDSGISDPFAPVQQRQPSATLFESTPPPDKALMDRLISDDRLDLLWQQIDALHEELVQKVEGDRSRTDVYQQELLKASSLLLESRANYDDARAIVYRVRADLKRQQVVSANVRRYRPLLLNYYVGWGIALVVLFLLKELFSGVAEAVGVDVVSVLYYPTLLGITGALISGYLTLERHTTRLRDFDPIHTSWYLFNPLLGAIMGLLMFLLASIANEDLLKDSASSAERAITYLLCVVAGMNQNHVLRQLNDLLKQFGRGSRS